MDGPLIQRDVDHTRLRIVLLNVIKEPVPFLDIEALAATHQHLPAGHIQDASQPDQFSGSSRRFFPVFAFATIAATNQWTQVSGVLLLIEEDDLLWALHRQIPRTLNLSEFLVVERIGRMHMLTSSLVAQIKALQALANGRQGQLVHPAHDLPEPSEPPS